MNRKEFLRAIGGSVTGLAAGNLVSGCTSIPRVAYTKEGDAIAVARSAFAATSFVIVQPEEFKHPIYLRRMDDETFSAVLLQCTHRGCEVTPYEDTLECPCHGSTYAPDGTVTASPATTNLTRFVVDVHAENVLIQRQELSQ